MAEKKGPKRNSSDYEVGYGKPPKHSRFKPGQSGNSKGRPKGSRNFKTDVKATLKSSVNVNRDGKPHKITTQEAMLLRLKEKALNGDIRSLNLLMALAQTYNNDELPLRDDLSGDDTAVLEIYNTRLLSGAARAAATGKLTGQQSDTEAEVSDSSAPQAEPGSPRKERVRMIRRYRPSKDREGKKDG
jgi:hypothetical protein